MGGAVTDLTVLSLGAGVQSTALLLMCLEGEYPRPDCAIFSDTGWEPKAVYDLLERLQRVCEEHEFPLHVVMRSNIKEDIIKHIEGYNDGSGKKWRVGQPPFMSINREGKEGLPPVSGGRLWRQCTKEYKIDPIHRKIRELLGYNKGQRIKKHVTQLFGISVDEAQRMRDSQVKWITNKYPLIDMRMSRHNCIQWLNRHGWGETPKSACIGCPYHSNAHWRLMQIHTPDEFQAAVDFDHKLREQPYPGVTGTLYIHRDMLPLDKIDFSTDRDHGQMELFGEECEGMCGV